MPTDLFFLRGLGWIPETWRYCCRSLWRLPESHEVYFMTLRNMSLSCMDVTVNRCGIYVAIAFSPLISPTLSRFTYIMCHCEVILKQVFKAKYNLHETLLSDGGIKVRKEFGVPSDFFNTLAWRQEYVVNRRSPSWFYPLISMYLRYSKFCKRKFRLE